VKKNRGTFHELGGGLLLKKMGPCGRERNHVGKDKKKSDERSPLPAPVEETKSKTQRAGEGKLVQKKGGVGQGLPRHSVGAVLHRGENARER